jgi:hypothetical protein
MKWVQRDELDRGRWYRDLVTEDGRFRLAEGYDEPARRDGRSWTLFDRGRAAGTFRSERDATKEVERLAAGGPRSRQKVQAEKRSTL